MLNGFFEDGKLVQSCEGRPGPRTALGVLKFDLLEYSGCHSRRVLDLESDNCKRSQCWLLLYGSSFPWVRVPTLHAISAGEGRNFFVLQMLMANVMLLRHEFDYSSFLEV